MRRAHKVSSQKCGQIPKISLEWVEEWKGFGRAHAIEITAKADCVLARHLGDAIYDFKTAFLIEVGIPPVHA